MNWNFLYKSIFTTITIVIFVSIPHHIVEADQRISQNSTQKNTILNQSKSFNNHIVSIQIQKKNLTKKNIKLQKMDIQF